MAQDVRRSGDGDEARRGAGGVTVNGADTVRAVAGLFVVSHVTTNLYGPGTTGEFGFAEGLDGVLAITNESTP